MQMFKFNLGSNVVIKNITTNTKGTFGIVDKIFPKNSENNNTDEVRYRVAFPDGYIDIAESNLISLDKYISMINCKHKVDDKVSAMQTINLFDYLSENDIKCIATETCTNVVNSKINNILEVRRDANISLVDQILKNVAEEYAKKLYPDVNQDVLDTIKNIITDKPEHEDDYDNFRVHLNYALQDLVKQYINDNKDHMYSIIKDSVEKACKELATETFVNKLINAMNFKQIVLDIIKESE